MKRWKDYIWVGCGCLIVNDQNQILLIRRTDKTQGWWSWFWSRPWGAVEFWETIEEAIIREVEEELGVIVELFGPNLYANDVRKEEGLHWFTGWRFAKIVSWELENKEPEKHDAIQRFDIDALPENVNIYTLQSIQEYKNRFKQNH